MAKGKRNLHAEFSQPMTERQPGAKVEGPHPRIAKQEQVDPKHFAREVIYEMLADNERSFVDLFRPAYKRKGRVGDLHPDVAVMLDLFPETKLSLLSSLQFAAAYAWDRALNARDDNGMPGVRSPHVVYLPMEDTVEHDFKLRARLRRRLDELRGYYAGDDVAFVRAAYAEGIDGDWIRTYLPPRAKAKFAEHQRLRGRVKEAVASLYMQHGNTDEFRQELREHGIDPALADRYVKLHVEAFGDEAPRWPADALEARKLIDSVQSGHDSAEKTQTVQRQRAGGTAYQAGSNKTTKRGTV